MKTLKKIHAGSPLLTNAAWNRVVASKAFAAGVTVEQIAEFWPKVFILSVENGRSVIGQKYDYELADGSGRYETNRRITADSLKACIQRYTTHPESVMRKPTVTDRLNDLHDRGFDASYALGRDDSGRFCSHIRVKCSRCDARVINGVACHETGCTNIRRDDEDVVEDF